MSLGIKDGMKTARRGLDESLESDAFQVDTGAGCPVVSRYP
jgi:hypothetical protein